MVLLCKKNTKFALMNVQKSHKSRNLLATCTKTYIMLYKKRCESNSYHLDWRRSCACELNLAFSLQCAMPTLQFHVFTE